MHDVFDDDEVDSVLLADASNAFHRLNRRVCLRNIRHLCPSLAPTIINTYRHLAKLFVDGECLLSCEGTTQGDLVAVPMYALGIVPLVQAVSSPDITQVWYADDSSGGGRLRALRTWWDGLTEQGEAYGYHLNASKSLLLVKERAYDEAVALFADTGVQIVRDGCRHLGAALGTPEFVSRFVESKVTNWTCQVSRLSDFTRTHSRAVTNELRERIVKADPSLAGVADATKTAKRQVRTAARASQQQLKEGFVSGEGAVQHAAQLELVSERGSSAWLTSRPLSCCGFRLSTV